MIVEKSTKPSTDGNDVTKTAPETVPSAQQETPPMLALDPRLVTLLLEDKAEQAIENKKRKEIAERKRQAGRENTQVNEVTATKAIQTCCRKNHLKGGKHRQKHAAKDVAFSVHKFIDGVVRVRCQICPFEVWSARQGGKIPADSRETIWRDNGNGFRSQPNPSYNPTAGLPGLGFAEALQMAREDSSNTETSSEMVIDNPQLVANQLEKENAELKARLEALETQK